MLHLQWYDFLRFATMGLAMWSMYNLGRRALQMWDQYTDRLKDLWWVINAMLLLLIEGSLEQVIANIHAGPRTILSFIVAAVCARATTKDEGYLKSETQ